MRPEQARSRGPRVEPAPMPLARLCPGCGAVVDPGVADCRTCRRERDRARGTTTERGLGWQHQRRRAALVRSGDTTCWLCGKPGSWTDPDDPLTADHVTLALEADTTPTTARRIEAAMREGGRVAFWVAAPLTLLPARFAFGHFDRFADHRLSRASAREEPREPAKGRDVRGKEAPSSPRRAVSRRRAAASDSARLPGGGIRA